ncbi:hypothetical protein NX059_005267 [Plenodomus lindquistii]|nr:hypothetical protein NX059_005267 [Plenodomus lindquistii]
MSAASEGAPCMPCAHSVSSHAETTPKPGRNHRSLPQTRRLAATPAPLRTVTLDAARAHPGFWHIASCKAYSAVTSGRHAEAKPSLLRHPLRAPHKQAARPSLWQGFPHATGPSSNCTPL